MFFLSSNGCCWRRCLRLRQPASDDPLMLALLARGHAINKIGQRKPEIAIRSGGNFHGTTAFCTVCCRDREFGDGPSRGDAPNLATSLLSKPEIAIGPSSNPVRPALRSRERKFGDGASRGDTPNLVPGKVRIPEVAIRSGGNIRSIAVCRRKWNFSNGASRGDAPNLAKLLGEPEVAIRPGGDSIGAVQRLQRKFGNLSAWGDASNLAYGKVCKPEIAIRPSGNPIRRSSCRKWKFGDLSSRADTPNLAASLFSEPEIAIWPFGDALGDAVGGWQGKFGNMSSRGDASNLALTAVPTGTGGTFGKPEVAIWPSGDPIRISGGRCQEKLGERACGLRGSPIAGGLRPVGGWRPAFRTGGPAASHNQRCRQKQHDEEPGKQGIWQLTRFQDSVCAHNVPRFNQLLLAQRYMSAPVAFCSPWICAYLPSVRRSILLPCCSVNQRLPSGPTVIPMGKPPEVGIGNRAISPSGVRRPIAPVVLSVNQRLPSVPAAIPLGRPPGTGEGNSVTCPPGVMRPIALPVQEPGAPSKHSVNQRFLSGPTVIPSAEPAVGIGNSVICPPGVIRPTLLLVSVNQRLPSGPAVILVGPLPVVGRGNSVICPPGVIRPSLSASGSVNQRLPSGPLVMPSTPVCAGNSVICPPGVMRPILPVLSSKVASVNQRLLSGPVVMSSGSSSALGTGNSVICPLGVMRPILPLPQSDPLQVNSVNQRLPSGPAVILVGPPPAVGRGNSVMFGSAWDAGVEVSVAPGVVPPEGAPCADGEPLVPPHPASASISKASTVVIVARATLNSLGRGRWPTRRSNALG